MRGIRYAGRSLDDMAQIAEAERAGVVRRGRTPARGGPCRADRLDGQFADRRCMRLASTA